MGPVRYHLYRQVRRRAEALGAPVAAARGHGAGRLAAGRVLRRARAGVRLIPQPPLPADLTLEDEVSQFERLKPRLQEMWDTILNREEEPHTSVVVPSLTLDQAELRRLPGASFYEERLLFLLIRLRNPRARMVYVTAQPVHPMILEYYFQFLAGIPASHARARLTLLCAHDSSPRSLTEKILERPRLLQRIRDGIVDTGRAYLTVFNSTPLERKLAVLLGIPLNGVDPNLIHLGTKSGSRKVFREAGVPVPEGVEDLRTEHDVESALVELRERRPRIRRAVVKLNDSFSGEGNALFRYPRGRVARGGEGRPAQPRVLAPHRGPGGLLLQVRAHGRDRGGVHRAPRRRSRPRRSSGSARAARWSPISTHDQILGGPSGQTFLGCSFPAHQDYRMQIAEAAHRIGAVLGQPRRGQPVRGGLPGLAQRGTGGLEPRRPGDQPPDGRHHPPLPRAAVPDRRSARSGDGAVPVAAAGRPSTTARRTT